MELSPRGVSVNAMNTDAADVIISTITALATPPLSQSQSWRLPTVRGGGGMRRQNRRARPSEAPLAHLISAAKTNTSLRCPLEESHLYCCLYL